MPGPGWGITYAMLSGTSVVTIGNFDGCHIGHSRLIRQARELADESGSKVVAMGFYPHPARVLRPEAAPALLTTWERRCELLRELGADEVVRLEPTKELLGLDPLGFVQQFVEPLAPTHIVEGSDFCFGKGRTGNLDVLQVLGEAFGYEVVEVEPVRGVLTDNTEVVASSSIIRRLLRDGRVRDATALLGRPHRVTGTVERGDRLGREIGYPTANVACQTLATGDGVYAGWAHLPTGKTYPAAISMGTRPTVNGLDERFEVYVMDAPSDEHRLAGLDEYGWTIEVDVVGRIRDQIKFGSVETLIEELERDCRRVRLALDRTISSGVGS